MKALWRSSSSPWEMAALSWHKQTPGARSSKSCWQAGGSVHTHTFQPEFGILQTSSSSCSTASSTFLQGGSLTPRVRDPAAAACPRDAITE